MSSCPLMLLHVYLYGTYIHAVAYVVFVIIGTVLNVCALLTVTTPASDGVGICPYGQDDNA